MAEKKQKKQPTERPSDSIYSAEVSVNGEIVKMVEKRRRARYRPWLVEFMAPDDELERRPLSAEELRCAGPSAVVNGIIATCKRELLQMANRGIYGGYITPPSRREFVRILSSNGKLICQAFDWLEAMKALKPHDVGFILSPFVAYVGPMVRLKRDPAYAAKEWMPSAAAWREFWEQAARRPLLAKRAQEILRHLAEQDSMLQTLREGTETETEAKAETETEAKAETETEAKAETETEAKAETESKGKVKSKGKGKAKASKKGND